MRIVGGSLRGRKLEAFPGQDVRPTLDRIRESLFNILEHGPYAGDHGPMPRGISVLDAFAGTGALGLEALSRGAAHATFMDTDTAAVDLIRRNLTACRLADHADVRTADATRPPANRSEPCALVLLDAPYGKGLTEAALPALAQAGWIGPDSVIVAELAAKESFTCPDGFTITDDRRYGATRLVFLVLD
jgi:16S rRNA (guanine966-N2)-methyltransferase